MRIRRILLNLKEFSFSSANSSICSLRRIRATFLLIVATLCCQNLFAQEEFAEGYIVTLQNDTTNGWIKDSPWQISEGQFEFKVREDATAEVLVPGAVRGFGFREDDRYYETLEITSASDQAEKVFAEQLLRGRASLYYYKDFFYLQKDGKQERIDKIKVRQASSENGRYLHQHKIYIGTLNRYFSDCLPEKLLQGNVAYNEKDFVDVFKKYSECSGVEYYQYKQRRQKRRITFQVFAGVSNSSITFQDPDLDIYRRDNNFFIGGGLTLPLAFLGDRCFFTVDAAYHSNVYRGTRAGFTPTGAVEKDYILELSSIRIPAGIKVELSRSGFIPYLRGGLTGLLPLRGEARIENNGTTEGEFKIEEKNASLVYWGGFGAKIRMKSGKYLFVELRGEKFVDYVGFYGPQGATNIPSAVFNKMFILGMNF